MAEKNGLFVKHVRWRSRASTTFRPWRGKAATCGPQGYPTRHNRKIDRRIRPQSLGIVREWVMEPKFTYLVYDETMRSVNLAVAHMQEVLNQKASEGWELHSFTMDTGGGRCLYIFKKPVS